jgi:hypothetical protein
MPDSIIIAIVVVVVIIAHVWLYAWVRFKMQQGIILQFLRDSAEADGYPGHSSESISTHTGIPADKVVAVCVKSKQIEQSGEDGGWWRPG